MKERCSNRLFEILFVMASVPVLSHAILEYPLASPVFLKYSTGVLMQFGGVHAVPGSERSKKLGVLELWVNQRKLLHVVPLRASGDIRRTDTRLYKSGT
jgi:hypothetical protein